MVFVMLWTDMALERLKLRLRNVVKSDKNARFIQEH